MDRIGRFFRLICALLAVMLLAVSLCACSAPASKEEPEEVVPGDWPVKAWRRSAPEAQGVDSAVLYDMLTSVKQGGYDIHSVMLIRNGYLVAGAFDAPGSKDVRQEVYSCTKSVTSALLGIAMEEGYIKDLDATLGEILGGQVLQTDRAGIKLRELLTMSAGFPGLETLRSYEIPEKPDVLKFILDLPVGEKGKFVYNNACPHLVSTLIQKATGKKALDYAREKLFDKLGIDCREWVEDRAGVNVGGSGMKLTPFEMSKIGYLYLKNGEWDGAQLVPRKWVEESTAKKIDTQNMNDAENHGYGYFWWRNAFGGYSAHGAGGQYIFVVPEHDLVAVFTSTLDDVNFPLPYRLMEQYVVPACKSKESLPENPDAARMLEEAVKSFA